jgi:membrane-associated phospholipid phosphatase
MQGLCALPPPPGMIWHYPGFPSLFVTYGVANDFFFSGHTAIAVLGATELARLHKTRLTASAILLVLFEITAVIVLRAHYTMDIFTGLLAALCVAAISESVSRWVRPASSR